MGPIAGYVYSIHHGVIDGARWRFNLSYADPYRDWCEQQNVYALSPSDDEFNCVPSHWGGHGDGTHFYFEDPEGGPDVIVDAQTFELCDNEVCECNACGCTGNTDLGQSPRFDVRCGADEMSGAFDEYEMYDAYLQLTDE